MNLQSPLTGSLAGTPDATAADAFARQHEALFAELQQQGLTHRAMAAELNARGIAAAKGGEWTHGQVQRILNRYADWKAAESAPA